MKRSFTKAICLLFTLCGLTLQVMAQAGKGTISGKVVDATNGTPVDYATISVYKPGAKSPFNGISSDIRGDFKVDNVPDGSYKVTVEFLGYQRTAIEQVIVKGGSAVLGVIKLYPSQTTLKGVTITGNAPVIQNKIDKIVYNAENDLTSQGGVATDILKKVPQVTVDIDGNVQLLGSSGVRFLINGKPSTIFGSSIADALQSIPASQIKSVEVISSPGAKYDAAGTAGIINIILKKNNIYGLNGNVNLSAGTRRNNGSINLSAKKGNFGISTFLSGNNQFNTKGLNGTNRTSFFADTTNNLLQNGDSRINRNGIRTGLSIDWDINKKNNVSASVGYDAFNSDNSNSTNQQTRTFKGSTLTDDLSSLLNGNNHFNERSVDLTLAYKKTFERPDEELNIEANAGLGRSTSAFTQQESLIYSDRPFSGLNSNNHGVDNEVEVKLDYTYPVNDDFIIESGAKTTFNSIAGNTLVNSLDNSSQQFIPSPTQSNSLDYKRDIVAAYLSGTYKLFNYLDVKSGLRYERTISNASYSQVGKINIAPYNTFAPSLVIARNFKNKNSLKLSYSYRIERPDYEDLNPFLDLSDPRNASMGNPNLKPEIGNNFELGFNKNYEKGGNLNISIFYRHNGQDIKSFATFYPSYVVGDSTYKNLTLNTRLNIGQEIREGISISGSIPFGSKLTVRPNMFIANQTIVNKYSGGPNINGFRARMNLNASYEFNSDFSAELFGNYNSPENNIQGKRPAFFLYNLALRKMIFNRKGSIGFTATNPFNEYVKQESTIYADNSTRTSYRQVPFRSFGLTFTYKFGGLDFKKDKDNSTDNQPSFPTDNGN
ncbi:TonB-dependent receptor domain-containing protein [Mucilaginibacter segetis]|uniref:TonB-dependent receptor n=1 Tax=Mucilaginibacter segetis TaxID=2793071 RepID=A0A934PRW9_9SPHI|nr:TonB-dependent receptor [Mucilaginibacter segetis]MBK0378512.1 TonB-dependent receptor [Mucilaginibacter segetis]